MATAKGNDTDTEFVTVSSGESEPETKMVFDTIGDQFTGTYLGMRQQTNDNGNYQQARFSDDAGEIYFTNAGYSLRNGLRDVSAGTKVRITFSSESDTGQANPMRNFTVEVARKASAIKNVRRAGQPSS
jgi:hypothetical protein